MAGTFEGLGRPICGGYEAYEDDGTSVYLTVDPDGMHNFSWTDEGVDNFISVTIADSTAVASGYLQAYYANVSTTGVWTGGQINGFALDLTLSGTPGVEIAGIYLYIAETGTTVLTDAQVNGLVVNLENLGASCANRSGVKVYSNDANLASDIDAAYSAYCSGATGTFRALLSCGGTTPPEYFMEYTTALASSTRILADYSPSDAATKALRILVDGTVYNVPAVADSCT
jgi:hypothetical protein